MTPPHHDALDAPAEESFSVKRTADRIASRARRARGGLLLIALVMFLAIFLFASYGMNLYFNAQKYRAGLTPMQLADTELSARIQALLQSQVMRPDTSDEAQEQRAHASRIKIDETLAQWEHLKKIEAISAPQDIQASPWLPLVTEAAIAFGLLAFVGFSIQIGLMFMRYYARLAELYDTQVDALHLSGGDIPLAVTFMERFSPNSIDIGRSPKTVHEAVLESLSRMTTKEQA